jgi:hypothetical protein
MMAEPLPPLTPPDCNLRDFPFMPLQVARLRASKAWLKAKRRPELAFYMMNLWTASWHEVPAASLEDDEDVLADKAMCPPDVWRTVKDEALYGWIKAADGRLYHPIVAEQALEAWRSKLALKAERDHEAERKRQERDERSKLFSALKKKGVVPPYNIKIAELRELVKTSAGRPSDIPGRSRLRQGQGQGQGQGNKHPSGVGPEAAGAAPTSRGTRLAGDWQPSESGANFLRAKRPDLDMETVTGLFRDYWASLPGRDGLKLDWEATWRNWVRNQRVLPKSPTADASQWWESRKGILDKGIAMGLPAPAADEGPPFWEFTAMVWLKAGDGPWLDEKMQAYRYYRRLRDGGDA